MLRLNLFLVVILKDVVNNKALYTIKDGLSSLVNILTIEVLATLFSKAISQ